MSNNIDSTEPTLSLVTYGQLKNISEGKRCESFVLLDNNPSLPLFAAYDGLKDMEPIFPLIPVRRTLAEMLDRVSKALRKIDPALGIKVTYGYRSLSVQRRYFRQFSKQLFGHYQLSDQEIETVHRLIAEPSVAGHPTGGAVDVTLVNSASGKPVDTGSKLYDFNSDRILVFCPNLKREQKINRFLLRQLMLNEGFAPFDGEWWHFSYGDKEWAFYYQKDQSLYPQIDVSEVQRLVEKV